MEVIAAMEEEEKSMWARNEIWDLKKSEDKINVLCEKLRHQFRAYL